MHWYKEKVWKKLKPTNTLISLVTVLSIIAVMSLYLNEVGFIMFVALAEKFAIELTWDDSQKKLIFIESINLKNLSDRIYIQFFWDRSQKYGITCARSFLFATSRLFTQNPMWNFLKMPRKIFHGKWDVANNTAVSYYDCKATLRWSNPHM